MEKNSKKIIKPTFQYEIDLSADGQIIAGVDEVGRGCIAGPIVAGAVVFSNYKKIRPKLKGVTDSKLLSFKKRKAFAELIKSVALDYNIGIVSTEEIDELGIGVANVLAFKRALDGLSQCDFALIDGRRFRGFDYRYACITKGELKSISIAAASIIAKDFRDSLMVELHSELPEYNFKKHKGYGSKAHFESISKHGASIYHRKTFLKKFEERQSQSTLFD